VNRLLIAAADPFAHALIATAVTAPLGRRPMVTALAAGTLIDIDHIVAARSVWPRAMIALEHRPRSHALLAAAALGAIGTAAGGPVHGWAAFAGLASHLLRDAGDDAAPTPLLWPWAAPRQIDRRLAYAGIAAIALGSWALSRRGARGADPTASAAADGGAASDLPRTA